MGPPEAQACPTTCLHWTFTHPCFLPFKLSHEGLQPSYDPTKERALLTLTGTQGTSWCLFNVRKEAEKDRRGLVVLSSDQPFGRSLLPSDGKVSRLLPQLLETL